ncbi:hypothetical protein [Candidatus Synechococcus spongiarum]|uniref:hypothetical protein n=1 Tax=Candidatus Synechococcus spongiarum TaxID=431041 RepID=UPI000991D7F5|nr:hypothetical protein [Candidatus Synechococcus spongiarum]
MSDKIRTMLTDQGIALCIQAGRNRNQPVECSKKLYKMRRQGENPFARLKEWCCIATRYDRYCT